MDSDDTVKVVISEIVDVCSFALFKAFEDDFNPRLKPTMRPIRITAMITIKIAMVIFILDFSGLIGISSISGFIGVKVRS